MHEHNFTWLWGRRAVVAVAMLLCLTLTGGGLDATKVQQSGVNGNKVQYTDKSEDARQPKLDVSGNAADFKWDGHTEVMSNYVKVKNNGSAPAKVGVGKFGAVFGDKIPEGSQWNLEVWDLSGPYLHNEDILHGKVLRDESLTLEPGQSRTFEVRLNLPAFAAKDEPGLRGKSGSFDLTLKYSKLKDGAVVAGTEKSVKQSGNKISYANTEEDRQPKLDVSGNAADFKWDGHTQYMSNYVTVKNNGSAPAKVGVGKFGAVFGDKIPEGSQWNLHVWDNSGPYLHNEDILHGKVLRDESLTLEPGQSRTFEVRLNLPAFAAKDEPGLRGKSGSFDLTLKYSKLKDGAVVAGTEKSVKQSGNKISYANTEEDRQPKLDVSGNAADFKWDGHTQYMSNYVKVKNNGSAPAKVGVGKFGAVFGDKIPEGSQWNLHVWDNSGPYLHNEDILHGKVLRDESLTLEPGQSRTFEVRLNLPAFAAKDEPGLRGKSGSFDLTLKYSKLKDGAVVAGTEKSVKQSGNKISYANTEEDRQPKLDVSGNAADFKWDGHTQYMSNYVKVKNNGSAPAKVGVGKFGAVFGDKIPEGSQWNLHVWDNSGPYLHNEDILHGKVLRDESLTLEPGQSRTFEVRLNLPAFAAKDEPGLRGKSGSFDLTLKYSKLKDGAVVAGTEKSVKQSGNKISYANTEGDREDARQPKITATADAPVRNVAWTDEDKDEGRSNTDWYGQGSSAVVTLGNEQGTADAEVSLNPKTMGLNLGGVEFKSESQWEILGVARGADGKDTGKILFSYDALHGKQIKNESIIIPAGKKQDIHVIIRKPEMTSEDTKSFIKAVRTESKGQWAMSAKVIKRGGRSGSAREVSIPTGGELRYEYLKADISIIGDPVKGTDSETGTWEVHNSGKRKGRVYFKGYMEANDFSKIRLGDWDLQIKINDNAGALIFNKDMIWGNKGDGQVDYIDVQPGQTRHIYVLNAGVEWYKSNPDPGINYGWARYSIAAQVSTYKGGKPDGHWNIDSRLGGNVLNGSIFHATPGDSDAQSPDDVEGAKQGKSGECPVDETQVDSRGKNVGEDKQPRLEISGGPLNSYWSANGEASDHEATWKVKNTGEAPAQLTASDIRSELTGGSDDESSWNVHIHQGAKTLLDGDLLTGRRADDKTPIIIPAGQERDMTVTIDRPVLSASDQAKSGHQTLPFDVSFEYQMPSAQGAADVVKQRVDMKGNTARWIADEAAREPLKPSTSGPALRPDAPSAREEDSAVDNKMG